MLAVVGRRRPVSSRTIVARSKPGHISKLLLSEVAALQTQERPEPRRELPPLLFVDLTQLMAPFARA